MHTFLVCGIFSFIIVIAGYFINPEIENNRPIISGSICENVKRNTLEIKEAVKIPAIYKTILFFLLGGLLVPSFGDINYYFILNVVNFSKFTVSMMSIIGYLSLLGGVIMYNRYFKQVEIRKLLKWSIGIGICGQLMNLVFILRLNVLYLGISDIAFTVFTTAVTDTL